MIGPFRVFPQQTGAPSHRANDLEMSQLKNVPRGATVSPVSTEPECDDVVSEISNWGHDMVGAYPETSIPRNQSPRSLTGAERIPGNVHASEAVSDLRNAEQFRSPVQEAGGPSPRPQAATSRSDPGVEVMNNAGNGYHIIGSWPRESDEDTRMSGGLLNSRWQPPPHQNPIIRNVTVNAIAPTPHRPILVPENATWVPTGAEEAARNAPAAVPAAVPDAKTAHPDGACLTQQSYNFLFRTFQVLQISLSISIFWVEILFLAVWITPHPDHQTSAGKAMHAVSFLLGLLAPIYTAMCLHSGLVESVRVLFVDSILLGAWLVLAVFAAIELPTDAQKEDNRFYAACCVRLTLIVVLSLAYVIGVCSQFCSLIIGRARARAREQAPAQAQVQPPA